MDRGGRQQIAVFKPYFCNGTNEIVKIFNQKCVTCFQNNRVYAFPECGQLCTCNDCYDNKGDIGIMKLFCL